jgi:hypothetical protein
MRTFWINVAAQFTADFITLMLMAGILCLIWWMAKKHKDKDELP